MNQIIQIFSSSYLLDTLDKNLKRSIVIFEDFTPFLLTSIIFVSFTNVEKIELTLHLLKFEVRKPEQ